MCNPQVEELEPRHLLNGSSFFAQPSPSHPLGAGICTTQVAERAPFVDLGSGHASPGGVDRHGAWSPEVGSSSSLAPHRFDGRSPTVPPPTTPAPRSFDAPQPEPSGTGASPRIGADHPGSGPVAAPGPEPVRTNPGPIPPAPPELVGTNPGSIPPAPPESSSGSRDASTSFAEAGPGTPSRDVDAAVALAVLGTPSERPNPQSLPQREILVGAPGLRAELQGLATVPFAVGAVRGREGIVHVPDAWLQRAEASVPSLPVTPPVTGQAEEGSVQPSPPVFGVLTVLPPFDLSALELGMQQFLERMERMGQDLVQPRDGTGLCQWLVAGAAAVMACEIARRQLRRVARVPAVAGNRMPGSSPDHLFAG
jgi:hypothetical protein